MLIRCPAQAGIALRQGDTLQALEHTVKDFVAPGVDMEASIHVAQNQVLRWSRNSAAARNPQRQGDQAAGSLNESSAGAGSVEGGSLAGKESFDILSRSASVASSNSSHGVLMLFLSRCCSARTAA